MLALKITILLPRSVNSGIVEMNSHTQKFYNLFWVDHQSMWLSSINSKFHFFFSNLYYTQVLKTKAFGIDINFASILSDSLLNLQSKLDITDILITIIVLFCHHVHYCLLIFFNIVFLSGILFFLGFCFLEFFIVF